MPQLFGAAALATMRGRIERLVEGAATRLRAEGRLQTEHAGQPFGRRMMALIEEAGVEAAMAAFGEAGSVFGVERARGEAADEDERPIYDIVTHPGVLDVLEALMGPEHPITYSYAGIMRARLPDGTNDSRNAKPFPFHQDSQYFDTKSPNSKDAVNVEAGWSPSTADMPIVGVWVPLVDADVRSGCLQFIEGSHRWGLLDGARDEKNNMQTHEDFMAREGARPVAVPAKVGDAILFSNLVFHGSEMSNSDDVRWTLDWRCHASPFAARFVDPDAVSGSELAATRWWATEGWWSDGQPDGSGRWEAWAPWAAGGRAAL